mgnify:CR=1 FL=1
MVKWTQQKQRKWARTNLKQNRNKDKSTSNKGTDNKPAKEVKKEENNTQKQAGTRDKSKWSECEKRTVVVVWHTSTL